MAELSDRWFVIERPNTYAATGVSYGVQMGTPGHIKWERSKADAEALLASLLSLPRCRECGDPTQSNYIEPSKSQILARQLCFKCNFWINVVEDDHDGRGIILDGVHYRDGGRTLRASEANGFGGAEWRLRLTSGALVETNNLWCQGRVPDHFRDRLPDNAVRERAHPTAGTKGE